jgi:hypothetical protein
MDREISFKKMIYSILFSLILVQLSIPVYAPVTISDRFDRMQLEPVADLSLTYEDVSVRSVTIEGSGFGGVVGERNQKAIVIDIISYGIVSIDFESDVLVDTQFLQRMSLNMVKADIIEWLISGRSDLAINTPAGIVIFNGQVQGIATVDPAGPYEGIIFWMEFVGSASSKTSIFDDSSGSEAFASNPVVISLLIQGTLTRTGTTPVDMTANGQIFRLMQGNIPDNEY